MLTLAERYTWVVPRIINFLTPINVHLVLEDAPVVEVDPIDNIALGVKKYFTSQSQKSPGWPQQTPDEGMIDVSDKGAKAYNGVLEGCVPLAFVLLSLLKQHGTADGKATLELIYVEAKRRNKTNIVAAYETAGFGRTGSDQPLPSASSGARKRKRRVRK